MFYGVSHLPLRIAAPRRAARSKAERDKIRWMHAQTAAIENGFVYLPLKAHWLAAYVHELTTFPCGGYDDQVDSTSQALGWLKTPMSHFASLNITEGGLRR
jgi:predicted phage terminase large subunit-like protein